MRHSGWSGWEWALNKVEAPFVQLPTLLQRPHRGPDPCPLQLCICVDK
jgi:hypothetical protein